MPRDSDPLHPAPRAGPAVADVAAGDEITRAKLQPMLQRTTAVKAMARAAGGADASSDAPVEGRGAPEVPDQIGAVTPDPPAEDDREPLPRDEAPPALAGTEGEAGPDKPPKPYFLTTDEHQLARQLVGATGPRRLAEPTATSQAAEHGAPGAARSDSAEAADGEAVASDEIGERDRPADRAQATPSTGLARIAAAVLVLAALVLLAWWLAGQDGEPAHGDGTTTVGPASTSGPGGGAAAAGLASGEPQATTETTASGGGAGAAGGAPSLSSTAAPTPGAPATRTARPSAPATTRATAATTTPGTPLFPVQGQD